MSVPPLQVDSASILAAYRHLGVEDRVQIQVLTKLGISDAESARGLQVDGPSRLVTLLRAPPSAQNLRPTVSSGSSTDPEAKSATSIS